MRKKSIFIIFIILFSFSGLSAKQNSEIEYLTNKCDVNTKNNKKRDKIIHISDLHYGYSNSKYTFSEILEKIDEKFAHIANESIVIVTGDLIDIAKKIKGKKVQEFYKTQYKEVSHGFDALRQRGFCVFVVPGNHDFKVKNKNSEVDFMLENDHDNYILLDAKREFEDVFYEKNTTKEEYFPTLNIVDSVAYIGLNTLSMTYPKQEESFLKLGYNYYYDNDDKIYFRMGKDQLDRLEGLLNDIEAKRYTANKIVFYLHNIVEVDKSEDYKRFFELISSLKNTKVVALLAGHTHESKTSKEHWNQNFPTFVAGSFTATCKDSIFDCDSHGFLLQIMQNGQVELLDKFK